MLPSEGEDVSQSDAAILRLLVQFRKFDCLSHSLSGASPPELNPRLPANMSMVSPSSQQQIPLKAIHLGLATVVRHCCSPPPYKRTPPTRTGQDKNTTTSLGSRAHRPRHDIYKAHREILLSLSQRLGFMKVFYAMQDKLSVLLDKCFCPMSMICIQHIPRNQHNA